MRRKVRLNAACGLVFLTLLASSYANPVRSKRSDEKTIPLYNTTLILMPQAACAVGDIVYQLGESVPGSGPCEKCTCTGQSNDGTGVTCQTVQCEVKAGCKALHRADHCCPLYQCECTRNGKTYSNGQKLEDAENPCQVCYCQGGEIVCNRIACFIRNDCEPVYVEGSCCPEYDHCPPRDIDRDSTSSLNSGDKITYLSDGPSKQDSKDNSKLDINNLPKIQIKEVTQGKPINNEIRIKEVIPVSTKAPTFPREIPKVNKNDDDNQTKNDVNDTNVEETKDDANQPPQIIRVGGQLLFVKQGEIIPENASLVTPSPVFTVIGAEGLQRVEEDPEDNSDKEVLDEKSTSKDGNDAPIVQSAEEADGLDQLFKEIISETNSSTTSEPDSDLDDQEYTGTVQTYKEISNAEVTLNTFTEEPKLTDVSTSDNLDDDIQAVPIEHLPEHNPEYPPIPEDIMILSMTEDTLEPVSEVDFNSENLNNNLKSKDDEKIVIVKRPVIPLSLPKHSKNSNALRDNHTPEKILPDILPLIRINKTHGENESFVPEEWLKEATEKPTPESSIPLLTIDAALPDSILNIPSKTSQEEDDSNEYIFITNDTLKNSESNIYKNEIATDGTTEVTPESFTDSVTLQGEYRSPGEPYLVPEWERNQTIDDSDNSTSTRSSLISLTENTSTEKTIIIELVKDNSTNDNEIDEELGYPEDAFLLDNNSSISKFSNLLETSTLPSVNESNIDELEINENNFNNSNVINSEDATDSSDGFTNFILSTEKLVTEKTTEDHSTASPSTPKPSIQLETVGLFTLSPLDETIYPQKQKKNSALIGDKNADSGKKRNILADLINLVGDVAAIGHDTEVSTVLNSIDSKDKNENKYQKSNHSPLLENDFIIPLDNAVASNDNMRDNSQIELTEYNASGDKMDIDIPMENDKVEFTTRKVLIDKDMDETTWKGEVGKDIELIPKVQKNPPKKDPSLEKIKDSNNVAQNSYPKKAVEEDVIIYTTVQVNPNPLTEQSTAAPNKTKVKIDDFLETLITVDNNNKYDQQKKNLPSDTTENSFGSTIMKVTGRTSNNEEATNRINGDGGEKLAKRETNSQMLSAKKVIDNKYLDAIKSYFERRFIH